MCVSGYSAGCGVQRKCSGCRVEQMCVKGYNDGGGVFGDIGGRKVCALVAEKCAVSTARP